MSLEQALIANTAALVALTEALTTSSGLTKSQPSAKAATVPAAPSKVSKTASVPAETDELTYDAVKTATVNLSRAKGREAVTAVLAKFKVAHATELDQKQWKKYIAACEAAGEAE